MKKSIALLSGLLIISPIIAASEAYTPIAYGVKSLGMGGAGVATFNGAESAFLNPALLSLAKKNEISVGNTFTKQKIDISFIDYSGGLTTIDNFKDTEHTNTPYLAINYKLDNNMNIGVLASDYTLKSSIGNSFVGKVTSEIKQTRFVVPLSYKYKNLSVGASYIHDKRDFSLSNNFNSAETSANKSGSGYELGLNYSFKGPSINIGFDYKSKIKEVTPKEFMAGVSWNIFQSNQTIEIDYKRIYVAEMVDSPVYENQNIYAIGYKYSTLKWTARIGYRYSSDLYNYDARQIGVLLSAIYPYDINHNYTAGISYFITQDISMDMALVYSTFYKKAAYDNTSDIVDDTKTTSVALGLNYNF